MQQCKVVMLGDQSVGKSSIINRYIKNQFSEAHHPTIGIDFLSRSITVGQRTVRLQLWDTAGQERFRSLIPGYLKNCVAALIVFDLTNKISFDQLGQWIDLVREVRGNESKVYIIGNKRDMKDLRVVKVEQIVELANREGVKFYEVSAKDGQNIGEMFMDVCEDLANMVDFQQTRTSSIKELKVQKVHEGGSRCC